MSTVSNQKMEKSITKMADRSCRKCGNVDYKQFNSVSSVVLSPPLNWIFEVLKITKTVITLQENQSPLSLK